MGMKGRPLFDLNELPSPQDDYDFPASNESQSQALQPSAGPSDSRVTDSLPQLPHILSASSVNAVDVVPLPPGQHPLSCFRPFVRSNVKSVSEELSHDDNLECVTKKAPSDPQATGPVEPSPSSASSASARNSGVQSGELQSLDKADDDEIGMESTKYVAREDGEIDAFKTLEDCHGKAESEDGVKRPQALEREQISTGLKDSADGVGAIDHPTTASLRESSVSFPKESVDTITTKIECEAATDVQENTLLRSAPIDCSTKSIFVDGTAKVGMNDGSAKSTSTDGSAKSEVSRGHQFYAEGKFSSSFGKRARPDQKDAMLGKKRSRQTMFLDVREAARQAAPPKASMSRKSLLSPSPYRHHKDGPRTPISQPVVDKLWDSASKPKDHKSPSPVIDGSKAGSGASLLESRNSNSTNCSEGMQLGTSDAPKQSQLPTRKPGPFPSDITPDGSSVPPSRYNSWKQEPGEDKASRFQIFNTMGKYSISPGPGKSGTDEKLSNFLRPPAKKSLNSFRKQGPGNTYLSQDSSIERLHREATSDKLWRSPGDAELQRVPGSFESVQEYVNVFEPLLFEECRAQLHSTWEELSDGVSKDLHIQVSVKSVDKRERGWFDLVLLPIEPHSRLGFKEGDVAVVSTPKPGSAWKIKRQSNGSGVNESPEGELSSRTAGIVRRFVPVDTRDPHGAILHFHVGESNASAAVEESLKKKFQSKGTTWFLTVLGSLATTQREYVALHAFQNLHSQMVKAILSPRPDLFPQYEEDPPAMPDCFTQSFVQHLHRTFNGPQLAAIKWAAMHTAAGTGSSNGPGKRPDLWPFTLVQGPPGTGKTHTVWGMLNVIHLVQYQRYYTALLKKLAPDSLKSDESSNSGSVEGTGSIDDVLQKMDESLARILPKLCPKPRMLVCAPSNAATDEMLTRVLERGFIDGEMKIYRPDVARVGVDTQSRASQAVSVERRSEQLLAMTRDDVLGWLQQLRSREGFLAQQVTLLQKELSASSAAARSQGSLSVDPDVLAARDQSRDAKLQQLAAVVEERDKVLVEMSRFYIVEGRFRSGSGYSLEDARAKLEASFANEAEIVFTTVSSSGRRLFNHLTHGFDMVVIDEAAQASEVAVLPPLSLGAARCVLVGDPQQLPATVISRAAHTLQYSRSLFERFQQAGCPTMLLSVQYRMHPQIRDFPSRYFYQGRLTDSDSVTTLPDEPYHSDPMLRPYVFYDISHGRESHKGSSVSLQNVPEAQFAAQLYEYLQNFIRTAGANKVSVGVITPYKLQLKCLQQEFGSVLSSGSDSESKAVYINTVDAFQGQERDVIIMSCVRASSHGVGFVADIRRMNVALTRARRSLWVVGNAAALVQSEDWAALIEDAKERHCFVSMTTSTVFSTASRRAPGLLRAPRPLSLSKIGHEDSEAEVKPSQGMDSRQAVGSVKVGSDRLAISTDLVGASLKPQEGTRDTWQDSQKGSRESVNHPFVGSNKASVHLTRSERTVVKHTRRSRGV